MKRKIKLVKKTIATKREVEMIKKMIKERQNINLDIKINKMDYMSEKAYDEFTKYLKTIENDDRN